MTDLRPNVLPSLVGIGLMLAAAGCARQAPTAPEATGVASLALLESTTPAPTFPLLNGTFVLTTVRGTISGTYTGSADGRGPNDASLKLDATRGTGAFEGATTTFKGEGVGAFTGEGSFSLSLKGSTSNSTSRFNMRMTIAGTSSVSCVAGHILVSQQGTGTANDFGTVRGTFRHEVGNAGCAD